MQTSISWILFLFTIGLSFMQRRNSEAPGSSVQVPDEVRVTQKKAHVSSLFFWNVNLPPVRSSIASFSVCCTT